MPATYDDAQVMLRCGALFQDMDLGTTSAWVFSDDFPTDYAGFIAAHPVGSERFRELMRYAGFFETVATLWKHDLFDEDLLLDWMLIPWDRVGGVLVGFREDQGVPRLYENFEALGAAQERWTPDDGA